MNTLLPEVLAIHADGTDRLVLSLHVQPALEYFEGHFAGLPLLPGVVQVDWAMRLGRRHLPVCGDFFSLDNLKFQDMIFPGAKVALALEWHAANGRLSFDYRQGDQPLSSGRICFVAGEIA
ncbi:MAG TPA: hypothetical protein VN066_08840 [Rhodocyclaceae bacterium]|jgi:3-hydroxymyristoyl/3-hydroxydecanoyl-(acyl carrier protein) dehydratase|nr:hypothetical protein [Rhodocyclaceae bacterium]